MKIPPKLLHDRDLQRRIVDEYSTTTDATFDDIAADLGFDQRYARGLLNEGIKLLKEENRHLAASVAPRDKKSKIEWQLLDRYRDFLLDVFVIPGGDIETRHQYDELVSHWGSMAAAYLDARAGDAAAGGKDLHVCMSGGETILEIVSSLVPRERPNVFFYASALIGRPHRASSSHVDAVANATIAWARSGRIDEHCFYATVNPYDLQGVEVDYPKRIREISDQLDSLMDKKSSIYRYVATELTGINIALAGLGVITSDASRTIRHNRLYATNLLRDVTSIKAADIEREGAVGEIGYCYFDSNGDNKDGKWRFYLTAGDHVKHLRGIGFYRDMVKRRREVIVCAGAFKEPALHAALRGKLFNVLFTNEAAARNILARETSP